MDTKSLFVGLFCKIVTSSVTRKACNPSIVWVCQDSFLFTLGACELCVYVCVSSVCTRVCSRMCVHMHVYVCIRARVCISCQAVCAGVLGEKGMLLREHMLFFSVLLEKRIGWFLLGIKPNFESF